MNIFRNTILSLLALVGSLTLMACSDDNSDNGGTTVPDGITISGNYLTDGVTVSKTGAELTISVQSAQTISVASDQSWCTAEAGTKSSGLQVTPVKVTVAANTETDDRVAHVTFKSASDSKVVTITQIAKGGLVVSTTSFDVSGDGGTITVELSANEDYTYAIGSSWITAASAAQAASRAPMTAHTESFVVAKNVTSSPRTTTITFSIDGIAEAVTVNQAASTASGDMSHSATELASLMYAGINIGNTMECPSGEGAWSGAVVNETYIKGLKAAGFNAVRIPCAWDSHMTDKTTYTIDPTWLDRVYEVVSWCVSNDMYVVLNAHWDNGWLEDNIFKAAKQSAIVAEQKAIWTQVATKMNAFDEHLLFAACNEPGMNETSGNEAKWADQEAVARVVEYEQTMIDAVRATGGNNATRCLVVQGLGTSISSTYTYMKSLPTDNVADRLMVEVHFYEPYQFCLMEEDASWGKTFWYWGKDNHVSGSEHNPDWGEESWLTAQLDKMKELYTSKNIPVIIGEYSAMFRTVSENQEMHDKSVAYYGQVVTEYAKNAGCVPFYWETGSVINRANGAVKKQAVVDGLMKGAAAGKYPW